MDINLKGIIPPVITPLKGDNELDEKGLERLIEYLIAGGVHGIFLLGTTGEATNLSYKLRQDFIEKACAVINKRVPVMVGITDTSVTGSLEMATVSKNAGADALVISSPYYLPMAQHEFVEYLEFLTPKLPLPFLLYNMPSCTKMHMAVETVKKAKELGAIGIKDSSGDLGYFYSLLEAFKDSPEFSIIVGTEIFIPESVIFGGSGGIAGGANIFPRIYVDLYEAALTRDMDKISRLRDIVVQVGEKIYNIGTYNSRHIKSIKCALSALGICDDYVAQPFRKFDKEESERIEQNIQELSNTFPEIDREISNLKL
jgi:4-hydroxy-tetrahydrodipicolinate synthase